MFQCSGRRFGHSLRQPGGAPLRHQDCRTTGGMRGSDDGSEIMRIFDAVENHQKLGAPNYVIETGVIVSCPKGHDTLMVRASARRAIQRFSRFKPYRYLALAAESNNLLQARAACPTRNQNPIDGPLCTERLAHRMDSCDHLSRVCRSFSVAAIC